MRRPSRKGFCLPPVRAVFTAQDVRKGQQVFLKFGLMENGTIWGHGAYLGPDFSAEYLHTLAGDAQNLLASQLYHREMIQLTPEERQAVYAEAQHLLKTNRYDPRTNSLAFTEPESRVFPSGKSRSGKPTLPDREQTLAYQPTTSTTPKRYGS